jgi:RHS repeat-associated protein
MATSAGTGYTYDSDGQRAKKGTSGRLYWYGLRGEVLAESDWGGTLISEFIYFNGRRIARRDVSSGNVYYYITDHIGNARVVTDASGVIKDASDYYPFGGERIITDTLDNTYKFTGMERDGEAASFQDHTLHRQYYPSHGRWMSPDPIPGDPENPQSWNRYAHVLNDPLALVDPLGATGYGSTFICIPSPFYQGTIWGCDWREGCTPGTIEVPLIPGKSLPGSPSIDWLGFANQELGFVSGCHVGGDSLDCTFSGEALNSMFGGFPFFQEDLQVTFSSIVQIFDVGSVFRALEELADLLGKITDAIDIAESEGSPEEIADCHRTCLVIGSAWTAGCAATWIAFKVAPAALVCLKEAVEVTAACEAVCAAKVVQGATAP